MLALLIAQAACSLTPLTPLPGAYYAGPSACDGARLALAVAQPGADGVVVLRRVDASWELEATLSLPAGADAASDALALDGDVLLVASATLGAGAAPGRVVPFERGAPGWTQGSPFASSAPGVATFGLALALDGDRCAVTSRDATGAGRVHVFARTAPGSWTESALIEAPATSQYGPVTSFGDALALDGDALLVGAAGFGGFLFSPDPSGAWVERQQLFLNSVAPSPRFGEAVALDGARALVADPEVFGRGFVQAYRFNPGPGLFVQSATLSPPMIDRRESGASVSLSGRRAAFTYERLTPNSTAVHVVLDLDAPFVGGRLELGGPTAAPDETPGRQVLLAAGEVLTTRRDFAALAAPPRALAPALRFVVEGEATEVCAGDVHSGGASVRLRPAACPTAASLGIEVSDAPVGAAGTFGVLVLGPASGALASPFGALCVSTARRGPAFTTGPLGGASVALAPATLGFAAGDGLVVQALVRDGAAVRRSAAIAVELAP